MPARAFRGSARPPLGLVLLLGLGTSAILQTPAVQTFPHPFLAVGRVDVPALEAATKRVMELADGDVSRLISDLAPIPLVGCPNCEGGSQDTSVDAWTIDDPGHVRCRHCGERYPGERYPLDGELVIINPRGEKQTYRYHDGGSEKRRFFFEGVIAAEADRYLLERAYDLGRLYRATKEVRYARRAAVILDRFAQVYPGWPVHGNEGNFSNWKIFHGAPPYPTQSGKWGRWIHDEFMTEGALAYDLVHDSPVFAELGAPAGVDVRRRIETDLFRAQVELVRHYPRYLGASGQNGTAAGLIAIGRAIEEPDFVHDGVARFEDSLPEWYFADGLLASGSPAYAKQMLRALESPIEMSLGYSDPPRYRHPKDGRRFENLDLARGSFVIERARAALAKFRLPDGRYAPVHDSWARNRFTHEEPPPESRPALFPAAGHAVLARGAGPGQTQLHFHFGNHAGHAHADELNIQLFAHGREMLGEIGYTHTKLRPWAMSTPAHNTVVVDRFNQIITQGWLPASWARLDRFEKTEFAAPEDVFGNLLLYDTGDSRVQVAEAEAVRGYRGLVPGLREYRRLVALVEIDGADSYIVDVFRVAGGREHLWAAHGSVEADQDIETTLELEPRDGTLLGPGTKYAAERDPELDSESFKGAVFGLVDGLSSASTEGPWTATWRYRDDPGLGLRLTMLAGPGRRVTVGRAPSVVPAGEDNARVDGFKMPLVLVEDQGGDSVFVAVWEPFRGRPRITGVRGLGFRGGGVRAVGLAVELGKRTDFVLFDPDGKETRTLDDAGISFRGRFGLVSEAGGKPVFLHLSDGTRLAKGRRSLDLRPALEGRITGLMQTPEGAALETDARLPGGDRLRGRLLFLERPDGRTQAYKISGVSKSGRSCLVFVEGGAGLEGSPLGYRETYFPHKEFAGGPGTFLIPDSAWTTD